MDSSEVIRLAVVDALEKAGIDVTYKRFTTDNIMIRCPFAKVSGHNNAIDSNPSLGLKISDKGFLYNCFTCHRKGVSFIQFVDELKDNDLISGAVDAYQLQNSLKIVFPKFGESFVLNPIDKSVIKLPPIDDRCKKFWDYNIIKRGLERYVVHRVDLRWNKETEQIVFPCYDIDKKLQGMVVHYINKRLPKYSNKMFDRANYLYLEWLIRKGTIGIITEGMYDAIKIYQHLRELKLLDKYSVVATYGNEVSHRQTQKMAMFFSSLFLLGDNDIAGISMERIIYDKLKFKLPLISRLPYKGKDPDSVNLAQFQRILKKPELFGTLS